MNEHEKDLEQFMTDPAMAMILKANVPIHGRAFECCSGTGNIARQLKSSPFVRRVYTNDIDYFPNLDWQEDATSRELWDKVPRCDWTVTNPPFSLALPILKLAWEYTDNVAFLLRWTFAEPTTQRGNRGTFLQELEPNLTDLLVFGSPRPSFTSNGKTDKATTAWFVWQKNPRHKNTRVRFITGWQDALKRMLPLEPKKRT